MKKILLGVFISAFLFACNNEKKADATGEAAAPAADATKATGDALLSKSDGDWAKTSLAAFSKGDIDAMTADYDDNARQLWSGGDSLVGKQAIVDYYKGRWKLIDSLSFTDQIVLPVQVNELQSQAAPKGKWTLTWAFAHVKYKNGKKIDFWVHNAYHHNDAGKVDIVAQYIDRHPIMEATKGMQ